MKRAAWLSVVLALGAGCTDTKQTDGREGLHEAASRLVPVDARELVDSPGLPWVQLSFEVARAPTEFGVSRNQLAEAQRDGWLLCEPTNPSWNGFEDGRREPMIYVTERTYLLHKDETLVVIIGRHEHETERAWKITLERGEAIAQDVFITARNENEQEARKQSAELGLGCS